MYSYLVSKDEYGKIEKQPRKEGQNLYFPRHKDNLQSRQQAQNGRQASQSPSGEGDSTSFIAGQGQASFPNTGGQRQASFPNTGGQGEEGESISFIGGERQEPNTGGQGFTYPQSQGYGGKQRQPGKQVNASSSYFSGVFSELYFMFESVWFSLMYRGIYLG